MEKTMRHRKFEKRRAAVFAASVLSLGMFLQPLSAYAGNSSGPYTKNGTSHVEQFGEYDVNAAVTVEEGKITNVAISGENFGGTYADVNQDKLEDAAAGMADNFVGLADTDAEAINSVDTVSGATVSSAGIREAVLDALDLELPGNEPAGAPAKAPEAGSYEVTVAVRSDVVDHSLVQTDTTTAELSVDKDGKMQLSYTMVSGTDKEPMYILGFNGYYADNDPAGNLTMEGVTYDTETKGNYEVVTDVSFPLQGLSTYYYTNTYLYVPAMSNLNGEISGIMFDQGKFNIKTIVTMYWDTLALKSAEGSQDMKFRQKCRKKCRPHPIRSVFLPFLWDL